jgi:hypothetical protein
MRCLQLEQAEQAGAPPKEAGYGDTGQAQRVRC